MLTMIDKDLFLKRNTIRNKYESLKNYINTSIENLKLIDAFDFEYDYFNYKKNNIDLPQYILCSLFVTWYSFIEVEVRNLIISTLDDKKFQTEKLRGCYLIYIKKFFVENRVEIDDLLWVKIDLLKDIRNRTVHDGPFFNVLSNRIPEGCKEFIEINGLYSSKSRSIFQMNSKFILDTLMFGEIFLGELLMIWKS